LAAYSQAGWECVNECNRERTWEHTVKQAGSVQSSAIGSVLQSVQSSELGSVQLSVLGSLLENVQSSRLGVCNRVQSGAYRRVNLEAYNWAYLGAYLGAYSQAGWECAIECNRECTSERTVK